MASEEIVEETLAARMWRLEQMLDELKRGKQYEIDNAVLVFRHNKEAEASIKFNEAIAVAAANAQQAKLAYEADKIAQAQVSAEYPAGTKMQRWGAKHERRFMDYGPPEPKEEYGIIEVFTNESDFPNNAYRSPLLVGEVVIRLLRANGKPSKKIVSSSSDMEKWHPVGWTPSQEDTQ